MVVHNHSLYAGHKFTSLKSDVCIYMCTAFVISYCPSPSLSAHAIVDSVLHLELTCVAHSTLMIFIHVPIGIYAAHTCTMVVNSDQSGCST